MVMTFLLSRIHSMVINRYLDKEGCQQWKGRKKEDRKRQPSLQEGSDPPEINKHSHNLHCQFKNGKYGKYKPDTWDDSDKDDHQ